MDIIGCILLLIVAICVIILAIIAKKRNDLEESISRTGSDSGSSSIGNMGEAQPSVAGVAQVTIYEYRSISKSKLRLCPCCDGENSPSATNCRICGQQLS